MTPTGTIPLAQLHHDLDTARTTRKHAATTLRRLNRHTTNTAATARALRNLTCADARTTQLKALIAAHH